MVVRIYSDPVGSLHLTPPKCHRLIAIVEAPEGSRAEHTKTIGSMHYVPLPEDKSQLLALRPKQIQ